MKTIEQLLHERERVVLLNDQSQQFGISSEIEDYRLVNEINESRPDIDNIINYVSASNLNLFVLCKKQDILAVLEVCSKKLISPNFITLNELEKMIAQGNKIENSCFLYYKCFHGCTLQTNKTYQIVVNANKIFEKQIYVNTITYYFLKPYYFGSTLGLAGYEDPCEGYDDILNDDFLYDGIAVYKDGKIAKSDISYFEVYEPYEQYDEEDNYTLLSLENEIEFEGRSYFLESVNEKEIIYRNLNYILEEDETENVEDDFETIENDRIDDDELELYVGELELYFDGNNTNDDTTQPEVNLLKKLSKNRKKKIRKLCKKYLDANDIELVNQFLEGEELYFNIKDFRSAYRAYVIVYLLSYFVDVDVKCEMESVKAFKWMQEQSLQNVINEVLKTQANYSDVAPQIYFNCRFSRLHVLALLEVLSRYSSSKKSGVVAYIKISPVF